MFTWAGVGRGQGLLGTRGSLGQAGAAGRGSGPGREEENRHRRLTRSTVFFLLVSARGPDTKASQRSRSSCGSSARRGGKT